MGDRDAMAAALREICALAPPCSTEAEEMNRTARRNGQMEWRDTMRKAQSIARAGLRCAGLEE